jgi:hypothetical protein
VAKSGQDCSGDECHGSERRSVCCFSHVFRSCVGFVGGQVGSKRVGGGCGPERVWKNGGQPPAGRILTCAARTVSYRRSNRSLERPDVDRKGSAKSGSARVAPKVSSRGSELSRSSLRPIGLDGPRVHFDSLRFGWNRSLSAAESGAWAGTQCVRRRVKVR